MLVKSYGSTLQGIDAITITIEVNVSPGVQMFIVGLPDNAVRESQQRIFSAFENNKYKIPGKKVIVNMAPANIRKEGSYFDLPIAVTILAATEQLVSENLSEFLIMGELSLDGSLMPIRGALPMALKAKEEGFKGFILPRRNAKEAPAIGGRPFASPRNEINNSCPQWTGGRLQRRRSHWAARWQTGRSRPCWPPALRCPPQRSQRAALP